MAKIFEKFLNVFSGDSGNNEDNNRANDTANIDNNNNIGNNPVTKTDRLTNQRLLEELTAHFKAMLLEESVGQRMLYPMSFNILLDPSDYNDRKQSLPFVLPEVVASFYGIIDNMRDKFPNFDPPAKYWYFQFSACQLNEVQTDSSTPLIVRKGHLTTVATLFTLNIKEVSNVSVEDNLRVSIKLDDSNVMNDVNINWSAIKSLDILSEGTFTYNFDETLSRNTQQIAEKSNVAEVVGLAKLSYSKNGRNIHYEMRDNLIHISGSNDSRNGRSFFKLESDTIVNSHVQIRYIPAEKRFQLAAFGPARLNSHEVAISNGGAIFWHDLADKSRIFINDEIAVSFNIK